MHGLSRPYVGFSYQDTAEILHDILNKEKIEIVFLVGMSMGGYPCQHFAALYPHMVKGFVALDTTPLSMAYYSKSDLWWLKQVAPMAKLFSSGALRISTMTICAGGLLSSYEKSASFCSQRRIDYFSCALRKMVRM